MKKLNVLIIACIVAMSNYANAQQTNWQCADDIITSLNRAAVRDYDKLLEKENLRLKTFIDHNYASGQRPAGNKRSMSSATYIIPVVFHIVYPAGQAYGTGANISYAQIVSQLNALNAAFAKNYPAYNGESHPAYAQNTDIQFCLARTTMPASASWYNGPGGIEYGVMRYADNTGATNHSISVTGAQQLVAITHPTAAYFPFGNYLNIWAVNSISSGGSGTVMGYAPRPIMSSYPLDGLVLRSDICGDNSTGNTFNLGFGLQEGKVACHEVGHYFNLYHIFQGGCAGMNAAGSGNDPCDLNGDNICDIEPCTTQNVPCGSTYNTCVANYATGTTANDMVESYMSYSDDNCMNTFTQNQCQRMWATLANMRSNLWTTTNLIATGVQGGAGCVPSFLVSSISYVQQAYCINTTIAVSNPVNGNTATTWLWQFPGGTPATASTASTSVSYASAGNKTIYLTVSDGSNTVTDSAVLNIATCILDSTKIDRANWFFGTFSAMEFSTGMAVPSNAAAVNNTMECFESSVSMSDSSGNLLFYSNGIDVWNKNHVKINTSNIFYHNTATVPGILGVPFPGHPGMYYIVSAPPTYISDSCARYVLVDLNTNTVSACQHFTNPTMPTAMEEGMTIVPHCNGYDYWVVMRGYPTQNNGRFYSILLTSAGLSPNLVPVVSANFVSSYSGQLKGNNNGTKLAQAVFGGSANTPLAMYDFNNTTGVVSNEQLAPPSSTQIGLGVTFSPNGNFLYLIESAGQQAIVSQYDVSNLAIPRKILNAAAKAQQFEIGPDNNIYIAQTDWNVLYLDMITNADSWSGSTYITNAVNFTSIGGILHTFCGTPDFIDSPKPDALAQDFTVNTLSCSTVNFTVDPCWQPYTAAWNFGDGNTGSGYNVTHTYTTGGNYTVTLTLTYSTYSFPAIIKVINVTTLPVSSIAGPDTVCAGSSFPLSYSVPLSAGAVYNWTTVIGSIIGAATGNTLSIQYATAGTDTLHVTSSNSNCATNATKVVTVVNAPVVSLNLSPKTVCITNTITLTGGTPAGGIYLINGSATNPVNAGALGLGTHAVTYQYTNAAGCYAQASDTLQVLACTGVTNLFASGQVAIVPNPFNNELVITSNATSAITNVTVHDVVGRQLTTIDSTNANTHRLTLNTSVWSEGIYFVTITCNGENKTVKVLKSR